MHWRPDLGGLGSPFTVYSAMLAACLSQDPCCLVGVARYKQRPATGTNNMYINTADYTRMSRGRHTDSALQQHAVQTPFMVSMAAGVATIGGSVTVCTVVLLPVQHSG